MFYVRYVDDTFLIYKGIQRQIDRLHIYLNNINAVSYTHLDVYKRQEWEKIESIVISNLPDTQSVKKKVLQFTIYYVFCKHK